MITKEQLKQVYVDWEDGDGFTLEDAEKEELGTGDAISILEELDVPDAEERVNLWNTRTLSFDDLTLLANADISVRSCDGKYCDQVERELQTDDWSDWQGINQGTPLRPTIIDDVEYFLCMWCLQKIKGMLK